MLATNTNNNDTYKIKRTESKMLTNYLYKTARVTSTASETSPIGLVWSKTMRDRLLLDPASKVCTRDVEVCEMRQPRHQH